MTKPLISVIVPAYNAVSSLTRCVRSVLNQTYPTFEIIVVDDGSTDGTGALADTLAETDGRISVIHQCNAGLSGARNTGIENARGALLYFLDSDDYIAPDVLQKLRSTMVETGAPMVVGGLVKVDEDGGVLSRVVVEPSVVDERGYWDGYERVYQDEEHGEYVVSCGKLFERRLFDKERFDEGKIHEDEFIIHRLVSLAGKIAFDNTAGYHYVQSEESIMHSPKVSAYLDAAEGFLARARYFCAREWWDYALTAVFEARISLSNATVAKHEILHDVRFLSLKKEWRTLCRDVSPNVHGSRKQKLYCRLFGVAPVLFTILKRNR